MKKVFGIFTSSAIEYSGHGEDNDSRSSEFEYSTDEMGDIPDEVRRLVDPFQVDDGMEEKALERLDGDSADTDVKYLEHLRHDKGIERSNDTQQQKSTTNLHQEITLPDIEKCKTSLETENNANDCYEGETMKDDISKQDDTLETTRTIINGDCLISAGIAQKERDRLKDGDDSCNVESSAKHSSEDYERGNNQNETAEEIDVSELKAGKDGGSSASLIVDVSTSQTEIEENGLDADSCASNEPKSTCSDKEEGASPFKHSGGWSLFGLSLWKGGDDFNTDQTEGSNTKTPSIDGNTVLASQNDCEGDKIPDENNDSGENNSTDSKAPLALQEGKGPNVVINEEKLHSQQILTAEAESEASAQSNGFVFDHLDEDDPFDFEKDAEYESAIDNILESFKGFGDDISRKKERSNEINLKDLPTTKEQVKEFSKEIGPKEPHPNQALFDILNRNFDSLEPFLFSPLQNAITSDDVKLCFVAFIAIFTPPKSTPFANEFNHDLDDLASIRIRAESVNKPFQQKPRGFFRRFRKSYHENSIKQSGLGEDRNEELYNGKMIGEENEEDYVQLYIPSEIVFALWEKVLFDRGYQITKREGATDFDSSVLNHVRISLLNLGLIDVRQISIPDQVMAGTQDNILQSKIRSQSPGEPKEVKNSSKQDYYAISVHHAINQEYGEHLASDNHSYDYQKEINDNKKGWFNVVSNLISEEKIIFDCGYYLSRLLPFTMINAGMHKEAVQILCDESFVRKRTSCLGILDGTTAQVTDVEELLLSLTCLKELEDGIPASEDFVFSAYEQIKNNILLIVNEFESKEFVSDIESVGLFSVVGKDKVERIEVFTQLGKSMHLMGVSLGAQGHLSKEIEYYTEALKLKRLGLKEGKAIETISISDTLHCLAFAFDNVGNFEDSLDNYDQALMIRRTLLGPDDLRVAETCHNKGAILCEKGDSCEEAMSYLEEALRIRLLHYGENHESVADTQQWMGNVMREWGDYDEALNYFETALSIKKERLGNDHEDVANTLHNMAVVLDDLGQHQLSIECYKETLRIRELQHGYDNLQVADTLLCAGNSCKAIDDHNAALDYLMRSIRIRESLIYVDAPKVDEDSFICEVQHHSDVVILHYGKLIECYEEAIPLLKLIDCNHEAVAEMLEKMADIYYKINDWDNAIGSLQGALRVRRVNLSSDKDLDRQVAELLRLIGRVHLQREEFDRAKSYFNDSLSALHGIEDNSILVASSTYYLGISYAKLSEHRLSLMAFTECLHLLKKKVSRSHIKIGHTLHWIGKEHHELTEYSKSLSRFVFALRIYKEHKGTVDPKVVIRTLHLMGNAHFKNNQPSLALKCYKEEIRLLQANSRNGYAAEAFYCAGNIYAKMKEYRNAIHHFEKSLEAMGFWCGQENEKIAKALEKIGSMNEKVNCFEKAKEMLKESYRVFGKVLGSDDLRTANVAFKLGRVLDELKQHASAIICYEESLHSRKLCLPPDHEDIATSLFYIGKNHFLRLNIAESISAFQESLLIRRNKFGNNGIILAPTLHELGKSYEAGKSSDKAMVCYKESYRIQKHANADKKNDLTNILFDIAKCYEANKNFEMAAKSYTDCLREGSASKNKLNPLIHHKLGIIFHRLGNDEDAVTHFESCLKIYQSDSFDKKPSNKQIASIMQSLAQCYTNTDDNMKALEFYNKATNFVATVEGDEKVMLAEICFAIGKLYSEKILDYDKALEHLERALVIRRELGVEEDSKANALFCIAIIHEKRKDFNDATGCLTEALRGFKLTRNFVEAISTLHLLAQVKEQTHEISAAIECYEEALELCTKVCGDSDLSVATINHSFACLLLKSGEDKKALQLLESALKIRKSVLGIDTLEVADILYKIGQIFIKRKDFVTAKKYHEEVIRIRKEINAENHADFANCLHFIGFLHFESGDFSNSVTYFIEALRAKESLSNGEIDTSITLYYLGRAYLKAADFDRALNFANCALEKRTSQFGNDSLECAHSLKLMGEIKSATHNEHAALNFYNEAIQIYEFVYGAGHITVGRMHEDIGHILMRLGDHDQALQSFKNCQDNYEENLGGTHEANGNVFFWMGGVLTNLGKFDLALKHYKYCLDIRKLYGVESIAVAETLGKIGDSLLSMEQQVQSLECFSESLRIMRLRLNADDGRIAGILHRIGNILLQQSDFGAAMLSFQEAQSIYTTAYGQESVEVGHIFYSIGLLYDSTGCFNKALTCYEDALARLQKHLDQNDLEVALVLNCIGSAFAKKEDFDQATEYFNKALEIRRMKLDKGALDIAHTTYNLANAMNKKGEENGVIQLFSEALAIYRRHKQDMEAANCLVAIANLKSNKNLDESQSLFEESLRIFQDNLGDNAIEMAPILFNLGSIHKKKKNFQEALTFLKQCLKIRMVEHGNENIDVAVTGQQLGSVLDSLGRFEDALNVYETALQIYETLLDKNHVRCATIRLCIGSIFSSQGKYDLAIMHFQICLNIYKVEFGESSENVANVLLRLGKIHDLRVDNEEAMRCMTDALNIRIKIYGKDGEKVAETMVIIGRILEDWGDSEEAMEFFSEALRIFRLRLGSEHPHLGEILNEIGDVNAEREEFNAALDSYQEALLIYKQNLGEDVTEVGYTLLKIGGIHDTRNDCDASLRYYSEALNIFEQALGKDDLSVALVLNNLGINLAKRGDHAKAIDLCTEALRIRRLKLGSDHLDVSDTLYNLGNILDEWGKDDQAMKFYTEALASYRSNLGEEDEEVANCLQYIGVLLMKKEEHDKAISRFSEALRIYRMKHGNFSLDVAGILFNLGRIYGKRGDYDKALGCFKECLRIRLEKLNDDDDEITTTKRYVEAIQRKLKKK